MYRVKFDLPAGVISFFDTSVHELELEIFVTETAPDDEFGKCVKIEDFDIEEMILDGSFVHFLSPTWKKLEHYILTIRIDEVKSQLMELTRL